MTSDYGIDDAALEQRVAELSLNPWIGDFEWSLVGLGGPRLGVEVVAHA